MPQKSQFNFQEVSSATGVKPYVLRFWESEFEEIAPIVASNGDKFYSQADVQMVLEIKKFLFEEKMTIEQAKLMIRRVPSAKSSKNLPSAKKLELAKTKVLDILTAIRKIRSDHSW